ncbi:hypothetical protein [Winogradskyella thalassocola]|uniref:Uncharacterized protein n=1 Tax=Winogradskyella thalassocola TaxID=262004 RepID=A0A1G7WVT7_9FLAO|nr:hypothetical protein [Winogradskyella thalassocola]SDG76014.1 hypothetical protein SAMN04489796_101505 [Winogradskyella thalassocola]
MKLNNSLLLVVAFMVMACSSNDDSSANNQSDARYKVLFSDDGDIVFIGDQTNEVVK